MDVGGLGIDRIDLDNTANLVLFVFWQETSNHPQQTRFATPWSA